MAKYFYENHLANQNQTASPDLVWVADFTKIIILGNKTIYIFLCIDIHTNCIITYKISQREFQTSGVIKSFESAFEKRFPYYPVGKPDIPLLIHTDRGTQFTSKNYNNFVLKYADLFEPSMSRHRIPKDNSVMERFVRTFKNHKIHKLTLEQRLEQELIKNPNFANYRRIMTSYVTSLNNKVNRKTSPLSPLKHDIVSSNANLLMAPPIYTKAFSERFGNDYRLDHVKDYKAQTKKVSILLEEMATVQSELVDQTPFDNNPEVQKMVKLFNKQYAVIVQLLRSNPNQIQERIDQSLEPLQAGIDELNDKMDILLPKRKKHRQVQKLRDPIDYELFPIFLEFAGRSMERRVELRRSQLRICYTILYYVGLRVNETKHLTHQDIKDALITSQLTVVHHKTKQSHIHTLSKRALRDLRNIDQDIKIVFEKYKHKYLFGRVNTMHSKALIRLINNDLKNTCQLNDIRYNIKSHSFRIYVISSLLTKTSVHNVADIIGHNDVRSTLKYARYALSKKEIQELFDSLPDIKQKYRAY